MDQFMNVLHKICKNKGISLLYQPPENIWKLTKGDKSTIITLEEITQLTTIQVIILHTEDCVYASADPDSIPVEAQICDCPRETILPRDPKRIAESFINRMK